MKPVKQIGTSPLGLAVTKIKNANGRARPPGTPRPQLATAHAVAKRMSALAQEFNAQ